MLYREIIAVCSQIHTKHINTLCGQNVEFVSVQPGGTYTNHWALKGFPARLDNSGKKNTIWHVKLTNTAFQAGDAVWWPASQSGISALLGEWRICCQATADKCNEF